MTARGRSLRILPATQRLLVRTARTPLGRLWALGYRACARASIAFLTHGAPGAPTSYLRASATSADFLPGLSDIDAVLVFAPEARRPGAAAQRARRRWGRLQRAVPPLTAIFDWPFIHDDQDLHDLAGACAPTYGLDADGAWELDRAAYFGTHTTLDWIRRLERPEPDGPTSGWVRLAGPERRPPEPVRDAQDERLAAWLECHNWWRWAFLTCAGSCARTASPSAQSTVLRTQTWITAQF